MWLLGGSDITNDPEEQTSPLQDNSETILVVRYSVMRRHQVIQTEILHRFQSVVGVLRTVVNAPCQTRRSSRCILFEKKLNIIT